MRLLIIVLEIIVVIVLNQKYYSKLTKSKNWNLKSGNLVKLNNNKAIKKLKFLTSKTKKSFNYLKHAFTEALIFEYFNPKYYIWI